MSAFEGIADIKLAVSKSVFDPKRTSSAELMRALIAMFRETGSSTTF